MDNIVLKNNTAFTHNLNVGIDNDFLAEVFLWNG